MLDNERVQILRKALRRFADFPVDGNDNECAWKALDEIEREAKAALEATKAEDITRVDGIETTSARSAQNDV